MPGKSQQARHSRLRNPALVLLAIFLIAGFSFYAALLAATRLQALFLPGNPIHISGIVANLPGLKTDEGSIGGKRINILVLGLDARPEDGGLGRSGTPASPDRQDRFASASRRSAGATSVRPA